MNPIYNFFFGYLIIVFHSFEEFMIKRLKNIKLGAISMIIEKERDEKCNK